MEKKKKKEKKRNKIHVIERYRKKKDCKVQVAEL